MYPWCCILSSASIILVYSLQNLLASHDIVAQRDYHPKLGDIPIEVDEDEETIKIVQLVKSHDPTVSLLRAKK